MKHLILPLFVLSLSANAQIIQSPIPTSDDILYSGIASRIHPENRSGNSKNEHYIWSHTNFEVYNISCLSLHGESLCSFHVGESLESPSHTVFSFSNENDSAFVSTLAQKIPGAISILSVEGVLLPKELRERIESKGIELKKSDKIRLKTAGSIRCESHLTAGPTMGSAQYTKKCAVTE